MTGYADDLALAHLLADRADAVSTARFRALDLRVEAKPDLTPVSDADTAVEREIRALLAEHRPGDGLVGEEYGEQPPAGPGGRRWVVDPIDGTKNFVRGVPIWATLIALLEDDRPVAGLVSAPALGRRWWAARGAGAYAGPDAAHGEPIGVSRVGRLADASFCYSSLSGWEEAGLLEPMLQLMRDTWRSRAYGDFYGYMLLAEGALDVMVEPELSLWDVAALVPIVTEAGGTFTDLAGRPVPGGGVSAHSAVASNGALHGDILAMLGRPAER
ncbi:histidinol-phosphatase [Micromonospora olivasterospora]|uniref:Histidinol-phosphatase n=1 Tax=Micromonospora olivasterospora TaxID=1880 RepID=A0A562I5V2_MICOL|nr:histidinol-phosphatase [Micromonospora olivasterospora]TWH66390.1 histidinol-phosphate phosphatase [Micromonospora olivasterospora]